MSGDVRGPFTISSSLKKTKAKLFNYKNNSLKSYIFNGMLHGDGYEFIIPTGAIKNRSFKKALVSDEVDFFVRLVKTLKKLDDKVGVLDEKFYINNKTGEFGLSPDAFYLFPGNQNDTLAKLIKNYLSYREKIVKTHNADYKILLKLIEILEDPHSNTHTFLNFGKTFEEKKESPIDRELVLEKCKDLSPGNCATVVQIYADEANVVEDCNNEIEIDLNTLSEKSIKKIDSYLNAIPPPRKNYIRILNEREDTEELYRKYISNDEDVLVAHHIIEPPKRNLKRPRRHCDFIGHLFNTSDIHSQRSILLNMGNSITMPEYDMILANCNRNESKLRDMVNHFKKLKG